MRWIALPLFLASTCCAFAQTPEQVEVDNDPGLSGLWKIDVPESIAVNIFHNTKFGPMRDIYCRIEQTKNDLRIRCLNGGFSRAGDGTLDGDKVHLAWGSMMARFVIDGSETADNRIDGTFSFKLSGISHGDPAPSTSTRLPLVIAAPDLGGKSALLRTILDQLADGTLLIPHDQAAIEKIGGTLDGPEKMRALGGVAAIAYLGQAPRLGGASMPDFFSVYAVEFETAERLCGLHQRDDGTLDAFLCI